MSQPIAVISSGVTARAYLPMTRLRLAHRKMLARAVIAAFALTPAWTATSPEVASAVPAAPMATKVDLRPRQAKGCKIVTRRDVDGDKRADTTTVTPTRVKKRPAYILRTVTAREQVSQVVVTSEKYAGDINRWPYPGSGSFDGAPGVELLMFSGVSGANSISYRMYSWGNGKLVEARAPGRDTQWSFSSSIRWASEVRIGHLRGVREMTIGGYEQVREGVWSGLVEIYQWRRGAWRYLDTRPAGGYRGSEMPRPGGFLGDNQKPVFT